MESCREFFSQPRCDEPLYFRGRVTHFSGRMTLRRTILWAAVTGLLLAGVLPAGRAEGTNAPDFQEVYGLLRAHLPGATEAGLNEAAVNGLLAQLQGRASLAAGSAPPASPDPQVQTKVLEQTVAYLRVSRVGDDLAGQFSAAAQAWTATNPPTGTVVDLRFTPGDAYATVGEAVNRLMSNKSPLLVLVNGETSGAAEVLAAKLRAAGALLIGNPTAGLAMTTEDFPLANGQRLRVATTPIKLNGVAMAALTPDILVPAGLAEERAWLENPYGPAASAGGTARTGTNSFIPLLDHTTEADLVRQRRKDGDRPTAVNPEPPARTEEAAPVLRDAVLARALDLARALAVLKTPGR